MSENDSVSHSVSRDQNSRAYAGNRRGAILILAAVSTLLLVSILALALDLGSLQQQRRMAQTAADAGALAGAIEIWRNRIDSVEESAASETKRNGFEHLVNGNVVTVTYPATNAPFAGPNFVHVAVERTAPNFFAKVFGYSSSVIHTQATAGITFSEYCLLVLDPSGNDALKLENSSRLTGLNCGAQVNSTSATGANVTGQQAQITVPFLGVGGPSIGGVSKVTTTTTSTPAYNVPPTADPMSQTVMPTVPNTCDFGSLSAGYNAVGTQTLQPGTYCGGINVQGNYSLVNGLYILRGGGLRVVGGGFSLRSTGTGTTFLNTAPPPGASYSWGPVYIQAGSVSLDLFGNTDPTSALPSVLFYTDPAAPYMVNLFKANSVSRMDGTMYFPTGLVKFESGATFTINGALIAYRVELSQQVNVTFTGYGGGSQFSALRKPTVVE